MEPWERCLPLDREKIVARYLVPIYINTNGRGERAICYRAGADGGADREAAAESAEGAGGVLRSNAGRPAGGIVLHALDGKCAFGPETLVQVAAMKKIYRLDLDAT